MKPARIRIAVSEAVMDELERGFDELVARERVAAFNVRARRAPHEDDEETGAELVCDRRLHAAARRK